MKIELKEERTVVTCVAIVVSLLFSAFVTINFLCRTTVMIDYELKGQMQGNLQLFYKDSKSDFSEDKSIKRHIGETGKIEFTIPSKSIDELRIDTDGIGTIAINRIEITSRIGFSEVIDRSNWGSHYISQNDMESIFDDPAEICYKASGADPFVVFKTSIHEYTGYGVLFLYIVGLAVLFFGIICGIYTFFGKYFKEQKFRQLAIRILFCCIFVVCLIRSNLSVINEMRSQTSTEYMVYVRNPQGTLATDTMVTQFVNHGKKLYTLELMIQKNESYEGGELYYQISNQQGEILSHNERTLQDVINQFNSDWDAIVIDCTSLNLEHGETYQLEFKITSENPVYIMMNENGEIQQRQTMSFEYSSQIITALIVFVSLFSIIIVILSIRKGFTDRQFLIAGLVLGIVSCFVLTPCTADDEFRHFLRVYDIVDNSTKAEWSNDFSDACGNIIAENENGAAMISVPYHVNRLRLMDINHNYDAISYEAEMNYVGCIDEIMRVLCDTEHNGETSKVSIVATMSITILVYLPQVIFAFIGKLFGMNAVGIFYIARIGNMLFALLIAFACIKILPKYRNAIFILYFAPNALWIRASCNRDSFITAVAMLFITYVLHLKENKLNVLKSTRLVTIMVLLGVLAIGKLPYLLLVLLLFVMGSENFTENVNRYKRYILTVAMVSCLFVCGLLSYKIVNAISTAASDTGTEVVEETNEEVDKSVMTHISYALANPDKVGNALWQRYKTIFTEDLGRSVYGYRHIYGILYVYLAVLILILNRKMLNIKGKIIAIATFMINWFAIIIVGYTFGAPDLGYIWGINPRYMIPILPLMASVICIGNEKTNALADTMVPTCIVGLSAIEIVSMITVYW